MSVAINSITLRLPPPLRFRQRIGGRTADDLRRRALIKLLAGGRVSGAGAALAGFGLVLFGLTTLQQGMGSPAERLHPADLPAVLASRDTGWCWGMLGALLLVVLGLVMTAVMQSSTAAIAVTLAAYYAGAVGLD